MGNAEFEVGDRVLTSEGTGFVDLIYGAVWVALDTAEPSKNVKAFDAKDVVLIERFPQ